MTSVALSLALVAVALVARDVALRALADRARAREAAVSDARRLASLEEAIKQQRVSDQTAASEMADLWRQHRALAGDVEQLKSRESMQALARKAQR